MKKTSKKIFSILISCILVTGTLSSACLPARAEEETAAEPELILPAADSDEITRKNREIFYLYTFLAQAGIMDEARAYVEGHMGIPTPFED